VLTSQERFLTGRIFQLSEPIWIRSSAEHPGTYNHKNQPTSAKKGTKGEKPNLEKQQTAGKEGMTSHRGSAEPEVTPLSQHFDKMGPVLLAPAIVFWVFVSPRGPSYCFFRAGNWRLALLARKEIF
jgi:hypothetical protein